ncbi:MAG: septum site-determining protein MinC [Candidatus Melainabacteria bacterium]|nr:septum site-determining protein MinC [Candidatus Melainabacteria bacterium]
MPKIAIKQNKKGTFLDLSAQDLRAADFLDSLSAFTQDSSAFLSGSSVSLILPNDVDVNQIGGDSRSIISEVKSKLNQNNISIKSISNGNNETFENNKANDAFKMQEEVVEEKTEKEIVDTSTLPETLYVEANLRSGQLIRYPGNVFVMGDVNPSAEIVAAGDIIIWGTLRGIAHAGADGDTEAKIVAMKIEAGQLRIANKIIEIKKQSNNKKSALSILTGNKKDGSMKPELVRIKNDEIIIRSYFS